MEVVRLVEGAVPKTVAANHRQGFESLCFRSSLVVEWDKLPFGCGQTFCDFGLVAVAASLSRRKSWVRIPQVAFLLHALVAPMVERRSEEPRDVGSNPPDETGFIAL